MFQLIDFHLDDSGNRRSFDFWFSPYSAMILDRGKELQSFGHQEKQPRIYSVLCCSTMMCVHLAMFNAFCLKGLVKLQWVYWCITVSHGAPVW